VEGIFDHRLSGQQTIKRISMMKREPRYSGDMRELDWQQREAVDGELLANESINRRLTKHSSLRLAPILAIPTVRRGPPMAVSVYNEFLQLMSRNGLIAVRESGRMRRTRKPLAPIRR
jgi:hypothetical protein